MQQILKQERAEGFPSLGGADIAGRLPLRESVLNQLIRSGKKSGIARPTALHLYANNRFTLELAIDQWPLPKTYRLEGVLGPTILMESDPRLLIMLKYSGLMGFAIKTFANSYDKLPSFVKVSDDRVFVDLKSLMAKSGIGDLVPLLKALRLKTETGVLYIDFNIHIDEKIS